MLTRTESVVTPHPNPPPQGGRGQTEYVARTVNYTLEDQAADQDSLFPTRPIRLFQRPEPIEATAEVPDGPPVQFTWRRVKYVVAHAEGPERIAMKWWRDDQGRALTRDYFRVESRNGMRAWLYREGFFQGTTPPRWYLHGLFA